MAAGLLVRKATLNAMIFLTILILEVLDVFLNVLAIAFNTAQAIAAAPIRLFRKNPRCASTTAQTPYCP